MPQFFWPVAVLFFVILSLPVSLVHAQKNNSSSQSSGNSARTDVRNESEVSRGQYIVENVAMCPQCHTPRNSDGSLDRTHWLEGAPVIWNPAHPDADWPLKAPRIGGTPPASDADLIRLLTTGIWTNGEYLRYPMMPFRMNERDAKAVVAYLRSVSPKH